MSTEYRAMSILGCSIPKDKLYKDKVFIGTENHNEQRLGKFRVIESFLNENNQDVFIGLVAMDGDFEEKNFYRIIDLEEIDLLRKELLKVLEKYELSAYINNFGLHALLDWY